MILIGAGVMAASHVPIGDAMPIISAHGQGASPSSSSQATMLGTGALMTPGPSTASAGSLGGALVLSPGSLPAVSTRQYTYEQDVRELLGSDATLP